MKQRIIKFDNHFSLLFLLIGGIKKYRIFAARKNADVA